MEQGLPGSNKKIRDGSAALSSPLFFLGNFVYNRGRLKNDGKGGKRVQKKVLCLILVIACFFCLSPAEQVQASSYTSVDELEVILNNNVIDRKTSYLIRFRTPSMLMGFQDSITLEFPEEIDIDRKIDTNSVTVNNQEAAGVEKSDNVLTITIPTNINILADELVDIRIASGVMTNPEEAGDYRITAYTTQDKKEEKSERFEITDYEYTRDAISKPEVEVTIPEDGGDEEREYEITFKTSNNGKLVGGMDSIFIKFPSGFKMPSSIDGRYVSVNGKYLNGYDFDVEARTVKINLPFGFNIPDRGTVTVFFARRADLELKDDSGDFELDVYTSADKKEINSHEFTIPKKKKVEERGIDVIASPDGKGLKAAYTVKIDEGALFTLGSNISGLSLIFPGDTYVPDSIDPESVRVNGEDVTGVLCNPDKKEVIFTLERELYSGDDIEIKIYKEAGIKNPEPNYYRLMVGMLRASGTVLSNSYYIGEESSQQNTITGIIRLQVNSNIATIGSTTRILETAPIIENNITLVPLRFVSDSLGAEVEYNSKGKYVTIKQGNKELAIWVNSTLAKVDGRFDSIASPAKIVNSRVLVPIRFISEQLGATVNYDTNTKSILIFPKNSEEVEDDDDDEDEEEKEKPADTYPVGYRAYVKVGNSYCNLRQGPGTNYNKAGTALPGQAMSVLEIQGDWYKVRLSNGNEAWVANWMVDVPRETT